MDLKLDVTMMILVERRREIIMENIVKKALIHMVVQSNVRMMNISAPQEPVLITVKNNKHARHVQKMTIMNAALQFAKNMKLNAKLLGKTRMVAHCRQHVL